ncbi:MAG: GNAT family N-acetyltransferase [Bacilli bacterium]|nr:GNAT family N-acetyltransferase [Bacilli bacterium]
MNLAVKRFNELSTKELYEILKARAEIFIKEQNINYQDMDDIDYNAYHFFYMEDNKVIAYLRAFASNEKDNLQIGRVLTLKHGHGLGKRLMEETLKYLRENTDAKKLTMHAQKHAVGFYEKLGFTTIGDEFIEEGVIHITMYLNLK